MGSPRPLLRLETTLLRTLATGGRQQLHALGTTLLLVTAMVQLQPRQGLETCSGQTAAMAAPLPLSKSATLPISGITKVTHLLARLLATSDFAIDEAEPAIGRF
jgi:hypothetical protein